MGCLLAALAVALFLPPAAVASDKVTIEETTRVRFLIVADTDAREGDACGMDASNLKTVLEAALKKQKLENRYSIDLLTGRDVTPEKVLKYYQDLKLGAHEALVFYYSGHGAYHMVKGHLLTFNQGDLSRASLLAAMQKHQPRLTVVLTDCCAIFEGEPVGKPGSPGPPTKRGLGAFEDAPPKSGSPPRPPDYKPPSKDNVAVAPAHPPRPANYRPPPPIEFGPGLKSPHADGVVLSTADGPLPLKTIVAETDGELLRHLFYWHSGVVDINGCKKGTGAYATIHWGGGVFTLSFLSMFKEKLSKFDTNRNGVAEWSEAFANLQARCDRSCVALCQGKTHQYPEAFKLAGPSIVAATK
jgi:hypothetical protein